MKPNNEIRTQAKEKKVKLWEIAEKFGISDVSFFKWLRHELPPEKKQRALAFIDEIASERRKVDA